MSDLASKKGLDRGPGHLNGVQVVGGSNPPIPTMFLTSNQASNKPFSPTEGEDSCDPRSRQTKGI